MYSTLTDSFADTPQYSTINLHLLKRGPEIINEYWIGSNLRTIRGTYVFFYHEMIPPTIKLNENKDITIHNVVYQGVVFPADNIRHTYISHFIRNYTLTVCLCRIIVSSRVPFAYRYVSAS